MFDKTAFAKMKPTSVLINIARGGIVNQDDLIEALKVSIYICYQPSDELIFKISTDSKLDKNEFISI